MNAISPGLAGSGAGIAFEEARARVLALVERPLPAEEVPIDSCTGRVAAAPVRARLSLPGFDQAAMDGYAVCTSGLRPDAWLPVAGRTTAGEAQGWLLPGSAHRILTGAPVPVGADSVIAQEDVLQVGVMVRIGMAPDAGAHLRRRGEDIHAGDLLVREGTLLDWRHVTVLAAQGIEAVGVRRRPRVVVISSGRELRRGGETLRPGQIHDSNQPMLRSLLQAWGAEVRARPVVADDAASMRDALCSASWADLILTSAGISVGEEDHVRDALLALGGSLAVLKVAMKPGKPLGAGRIGDAVFVGLPGNPQAALAGAVTFVRPLLARMAGTEEPGTLAARAGFGMRRKTGRAEFVPVGLSLRGTDLWAERTGPDGSGRLAPLLHADGLGFLPAGQDAIEPGDPLEVLPFGAGAAWVGEAAGA
ncbi:molybdopterin molybdotransferase [Roseomonas rosea]|uniref:Molybdopterin molybdenumtransferase n=1 Tax=Muricoccus roseus TaxID=198092 RepID=A0A1M6N497_9PROT|nr:gephyrin-like molybdotransferase Glp [Roseomonas rosea]SHJ90541.1 molybdopterin molybdotransferase [Roseomonas rosea]